MSYHVLSILQDCAGLSYKRLPYISLQWFIDRTGDLHQRASNGGGKVGRRSTTVPPCAFVCLGQAPLKLADYSSGSDVYFRSLKLESYSFNRLSPSCCCRAEGAESRVPFLR